MRFDVRGDTKEIERALTQLQRKQVPFARTLAMTWTAQDVQRVQRMSLRVRLNAPTRRTLNSVRVKPATKREQSAYIWIKDDSPKGTAPIKYLEPLIYGTRRNFKRHEKALHRLGLLPAGWYTVPGEGARLNRFGNLTGAMYSKILSDLKASPDAHQNRNSEKKRARFFILRSGGKPVGVYERTGKKRGSIRSILHFVPTKPSYSKTLPFFNIAEGVSSRQFAPNFERALAQALSTAWG